MSYENRNAVVLGLGLTGMSLAKYLVRQGARVRVADTRRSRRSPPSSRRAPGAVLLIGSFDDGRSPAPT